MTTLISLNVGLPQDVSWRARTVYTGIWKKPVDGPRMVRRLNIDGDGQGDLGGHGGQHRAVLVYQTDSYRYWEQELGREVLEPGQFGENFTVDGLPDDEVCIGDRYQIGEAVFEVSQPRVTCYRVGLRMGEPRMAALLVSHRRPGFYFRVITEGEVQAGQEIVKIESGPEGVTVADIDALLYLPGHPRDGLARALRVPALSPGWQGSLRSLQEQADRGAAGAPGNTGLTAAATSPPPAWTGFRPLTVTGMQAESRSVFSLSLAAADGSPLPTWLPGQSITLRLPPTSGNAPLVRNYSLSNRPGSSRYRIAVKQEPHGAASGYLRAHVRVGDTLEVAAPRGTFFLSDTDEPVVLVSAGVGVTPVLAMLQSLVAARSARRVWWVHGARDSAEHPFAKEARVLVNQLAHARAHICFSRPSSTDRQGVDYTSKGRLSAALIADLGVPCEADAYLCGPATFMTDLTAVLADHGLDPDRIHGETFGAGAALTPGIAVSSSTPPHPPTGPPGSGPDVSFSRSGLTVPWNPRHGSLLDFAEACDVPTRWSCRTGVCHTCETAALSGDVRYDPEPVEPPAAGNVLICCSQPTDSVVLDL
ncbi:MOSC and FAD-binding oxidoreductase domain-containing protein [Rhodococcus sp. JVH1]|uniref:MOSC and FAD-binding oxidoreductase domain-containing protein n=1 Tax=Rhodococcus sp. JVH1 TaxID=745408 RepID=UPI0005C13F3D|nr:MOSC and FAD-binding oxidoreductase domain-containing protein [Rhodococcus sp. JVH1]